MIDLAQLRLGNWVHHTTGWSTINNGPFDTPGFNFQWEDRHWYMLGECTLSLEVIEPIPLSSEWLDRFPFIYSIFGYYYLNDLILEESTDKTHWLVSVSCGSDYDLKYLIDIKFVHQLQNLFYSLTNTELTFKQ